MLDTAEKQKNKTKGMKGRARERSLVEKRQWRIQVRDHIIHYDKQSFAACCQAANIKAICCHCCVSRVLTANKLALGQN